jgi:hypothetical protein
MVSDGEKRRHSGEAHEPFAAAQDMMSAHRTQQLREQAHSRNQPCKMVFPVYARAAASTSAFHSDELSTKDDGSIWGELQWRHAQALQRCEIWAARHAVCRMKHGTRIYDGVLN